jgi:uncharacterized membrane protein
MSTKKRLIRSKPTETHSRSLVKAIIYRIIIIISIFVITYATTKRIADAASITGLTAVSGTIIYYLYERVWSRISWGRK